MPTLPWTIIEQPGAEPTVVFLASRLRLRSARHVPGFFRSALTVRRQVCRSPGAIGVSLLAQPLHKTFWTLSAWSDQDALDSFVRTEPHLGIMTRYHDRIADAEFAAWTGSTGTLPEARSNAGPHWAEGKRRLAERRSV